MAANKKLLFLPGDGIGPEVVGEVRRVIDWMAGARAAAFDITEDLVGGAAIDAHGVPLTEATMAAAMGVDAILLGACGGPRWDGVDFDIRPEAGLLRLRKDLELFANLRPAIVFSALAEASSLKTELVAGLDILIVRELTGGVYFGEPRGIETLPDGQRRGVNTQVYTTSEIERVARVAFDLARQRRRRVTSVDKANVLEVSQLWRAVVESVSGDYGDVELRHMYVDRAAMELVANPGQFDVLLTGNLFGDILSDEASAMCGSLGLLPSASVGGDVAIYEPVHGSAPDIAGRGIANPIGAIRSGALMLSHSFGLSDEAAAVEAAVCSVLDAGLRTADVAGPGDTPVGTEAFAAAVAEALT